MGKSTAAIRLSLAAPLLAITVACSQPAIENTSLTGDTAADTYIPGLASAEEKAARPTYRVKDFDWEDTPEGRPWKKQIVYAVNKIVHENDRCVSVEPYTLSRSVKGYRKDNPLFFITCDTAGGDAFGVTFDAKHVTDQRAPKPIDTETAMDLCEKALQATAQDQAHVALSKEGNVIRTDFPDGRTVLTSIYTMQGHSGRQSRFRVRCDFRGLDLLNHETLSEVL